MDDKPTHEITAVYFPSKGEVDLTWYNLIDDSEAHLTVKVTPEEGKQIARTVYPCVYNPARIKPQLDEDQDNNQTE